MAEAFAIGGYFDASEHGDASERLDGLVALVEQQQTDMDCDRTMSVCIQALQTMGKLKPAKLAQYADFVVARLEDSFGPNRTAALTLLRKLKPVTLAQYADSVVARLEDSAVRVRRMVLELLGKLAPAALAQHAEAVVARLEDSVLGIRHQALRTLGNLEPATLAQHADAVIAQLGSESSKQRLTAVNVLGKLEPATFAQHASALMEMLKKSSTEWREVHAAIETLRRIPCDATRGTHLGKELISSGRARSRLLGQLGWYRCRLRLHLRRITLYWYALRYRPSNPGHPRDVGAWDPMSSNL